MGLFSLARAKKFSASDLPRAYTFSSSDSLTITTMSTSSHSTSGSRPTSRHYDTGFPDSFASCTTSMRHPDAIIDPGFAISSEHIDPAKTLHRSRKSLLRKHRRTISHGKITEESLNQSYEKRPSSPADTGLVHEKSHSAGVGITQSLETDAKGAESIMGLSPGFQYTGDGENEGEERRRTNIFRKLMK